MHGGDEKCTQSTSCALLKDQNSERLLKYFLHSVTVLLILEATNYPHTQYSPSGVQSTGLSVEKSVNIKLPSS
jgi:hypothetical protein